MGRVGVKGRFHPGASRETRFSAGGRPFDVRYYITLDTLDAGESCEVCTQKDVNDAHLFSA